MSDKIAEHMATEDDVLHLIFIYNRMVDKHLEVPNVDYMRRLFSVISKLESGLKYIPKHKMINFCAEEPKQEKGEIMKHLLARVIKEYDNEDDLEDLKQGLITRAQVRKYKVGDVEAVLPEYNRDFYEPIEPIEQKWSEEEIRETGEDVISKIGYSDILDDAFRTLIKLLKTPKPVMRDRTTAEIMLYMIETGIDLDKCDYKSVNFEGAGYPNKATHYRIECKGEWLPIPQIEKEK